MSQSGTIVFFSDRKHPSAADLLRQAVELLEVTHAGSAFRSTKPDHSWNDFVTGADEPDDDFLGRGIPVTQLPGLIKKNLVLRLQFVESPLSTRLAQAI